MSAGHAHVRRHNRRALNYDLPLPDGHHGRALARIVPLPPDDLRGALLLVVAEEREALDALEYGAGQAVVDLRAALLSGTPC